VIITDANIWIDHIRNRDDHLTELLSRRRILLHPFTVGELALGSLHDRAALLENLRVLSAPSIASDEEVLALVEAARLWGTGIGYVDCHLLASARLVQNGRLWTRDKRLQIQADRLGIAYRTPDQ